MPAAYGVRPRHSVGALGPLHRHQRPVLAQQYELAHERSMRQLVVWRRVYQRTHSPTVRIARYAIVGVAQLVILRHL